jgi:hypothetical protein
MTTPDIRTALERLVELDKRVEDVAGIEIDNWVDAMDAARAALEAEPEGEGPTLADVDELCAEFGFHYDADQGETLEMLRDMISASLARWGHPPAAAPAPGANTPTPPSPEPGEVGELVEWIHTEAIHGPDADEWRRAATLLQQQCAPPASEPREAIQPTGRSGLTWEAAINGLRDVLADQTEDAIQRAWQRSRIVTAMDFMAANTPTPPSPEPGEVAELVEWLNQVAQHLVDNGVTGAPHVRGAAILLEQQEAELATLRGVPVAVSEELRQIGDRLRNQDNRCTANPIFQVRGKERIYGLDLSASDEAVWMDDEWNPVDIPEDADPEEPPHGLTVARYTTRWKVLMVAFTEQGCIEHLRLNGHNYRMFDEVGIYVDSLNRCPEMIAIREFLIGLPAPQAGEVEEVDPDHANRLGTIIPSDILQLADQLDRDGLRLIEMGYANESPPTRDTGLRVVRASYILRQQQAELATLKDDGWAKAMTDLADQIGGDGPSLWEWGASIPTPKKVVEYLREHIDYLEHLGRVQGALTALKVDPVAESERPWEREGWCNEKGDFWAERINRKGIAEWEQANRNHLGNWMVRCLPHNAIPLPPPQAGEVEA